MMLCSIEKSRESLRSTAIDPWVPSPQVVAFLYCSPFGLKTSFCFLSIFQVSESAHEKAEDLLEEEADAADTYASRLRKKYEDTKESMTDEAPEFVTQVRGCMGVCVWLLHDLLFITKFMTFVLNLVGLVMASHFC